MDVSLMPCVRSTLILVRLWGGFREQPFDIRTFVLRGPPFDVVPSLRVREPVFTFNNIEVVSQKYEYNKIDFKRFEVASIGEDIMTILDRILKQSEQVGDCLVWTGYKNKYGYGRIKIKGKLRRVHRVVYEELVGPIPENWDIDHLCHVRACITKEHLEAVSKPEHMERTKPFITGRNSNRCYLYCTKNHPLFGPNLRLEMENGKVRQRRCIKCIQIKNKKYNKKRA